MVEVVDGGMVSLCNNCYCMTKTVLIKGRFCCGKCLMIKKLED